MFHSFLDFIFPNSCLQCQNILNSNTDAFCLKCYLDLPFTHWEWKSQNAMFQKLHALVPLENACSLFYFRKGNSIQQLLHALKYFNRNALSDWLVEEIIQKTKIHEQNEIEAICSVPIHPKKRRERGYNQNTAIGEKLSKALEIPYFENALKRTRHQKSQTFMHREERLNRLENTFIVDTLPSEFRHILVIDDVFTTGATLLHCTDLLLKEAKKVSVLTLAVTV